MYRRKRFAGLLVCLALWPLLAQGQMTTGSIGGSVRAVSGEKLAGANIKLQHPSTGTAFYTQSNSQGIFHIDNLQPGGPYTLEIGFLGFRTMERKELTITLGEQLQADAWLEPMVAELKKILVTASRKYANTNGAHTIIDKQKMEELPAGRNLYNYLASLPMAKPVAGNEGAVAYAGQNNRYNAFYIDGAENNDVFGLSASGTNGGQTGISPVPIDAIEQLHVSVMPYDASLGNFTGAAINAVTRSGGNRPEISLYHFSGNGKLGDDDPVAQAKSNRTYGFRWQGPVAKNKLFYFINTELYREKRAHVFDLNNYKGNTRDLRLLSILSNSLLSNFRYDAGSFLESQNDIHATRIAARFDWNTGSKSRFAFSMRYMDAARTISNPSTPDILHAGRDGFQLFHTSWSGTIEWKMRSGKNSSNHLSVAYTQAKDDREPNGNPFPRVRLYDGDGSIIFGTDISSTINLLQQQNWVLNEKFSFSTGKHFTSIGLDAACNHIYNAFIQHSFGNYSYRSLADFVGNTSPVAYQLGFSLMDSVQDDHIAAAATFSLLRYGFFLTHEIRLSKKLTVQLGIRSDFHHFLTQPIASDFVNDTAIPAFERYYDLQGAQSGNAGIATAFSPRLGLQYQNSNGSFVLRIGAGIFNGRAPLAWPAGVYQYNGVNTGGYVASTAQLSRIRFRSDPYQQWPASSIGATVNKEPLNLIRKDFRMPSLFRTSLSLERNFRNGWRLSSELMFSKNLSEIVYTNVNLLPPVDTMTGPDKRLVYPLLNAKVPLRADGSNPYGYVILLGNSNSHTGYAWQFNLSLRKLIAARFVMELGYAYGSSRVLHDGTSSVNLSQWRSTETVNGRNNLERTVSDFNPGHQLSVWLNKKMVYGKGKMTTTFSLQYMGGSASPFSYVYGGESMVKDEGSSGGYELIYIPRTAELAAMHFLPLISKGKFYTPEQQKTALENYISENSYLSTRRGKYAERNGSRGPFTHLVNIKIAQDISLRTGQHVYRVQLTGTVFNIANLIHPAWGIPSAMPNDQLVLIEFAGYEPNSRLVPQYRFDPFTAQPGYPIPGRYGGFELGFRVTL
jgi:hypothetical protein